MSLEINIADKDVIVFQEEKYRIRSVMQDGQLVLENTASGHSMMMHKQELLEKYAARNLAIERFNPNSKLHHQVALPYPNDAPDQIYDATSRIRQIVLGAYDCERPTLSDVSLKRFITAVALPHDLAAEKWRPSPGTLRRDIKSRGFSEHRPMSLMKRMRAQPRKSKFHPDVLELMDWIVNWYYGERYRTISDAFNRYRSMHRDLEIQAEASTGLVTNRKMPSYETIRSRIRENECYEFVKNKLGAKVARRRYSGVGEGMRADRPLEVVLIDATTIDTFIVLGRDEKMILGRPTITIGIDVCTRMIVGLFITFEPASIYTVMNCVKQILSPKDSLLKERFSHFERSFVAYGKPNKIVCDNALENTGVSFIDTMRDFSIDVEWAPVKTPQYKAIVERYFHTLNKAVFHKIGGAVPYGVTKMREFEIDPAQSAVMTIDRLEEVVYQFIVDCYQMEFHDAIGMSPLQKWEQLVGKHGIEVVDDLRLIDDACGYTKLAKLSRQGVQVEGMVFHDQNITTQLLHDLMPTSLRGRGPSANERVDVKIKLDPDDISAIRVWNSESRLYVSLPNVQQAYSGGMSLWFNRLLKRYARDNHKAFTSEQERCEARDRLLRNIEGGDYGGVGKKASKRALAQWEMPDGLIEQVEAEPRHDGNGSAVSASHTEGKRPDRDALITTPQRGAAKAARTRKRTKAKKAEQNKEDMSAMGKTSGLGDGVPHETEAELSDKLGPDWEDLI